MGDQEAEESLDATRSQDDQPTSSLFDGMKLWLSRLVPSRSRYMELIKQHGGTVMQFEKDAPIRLVDHLRMNAPSGTYYSYEFVEDSIAKGELQNLEEYRVGDKPRIRNSSAPKRSFRNPFTLEEDQILYDYLQPLEEAGDRVLGYKPYEEIAAKYPKHTVHSWRDRYVKKLRGRPRPGGPRPAGAQAAATEETPAPTTPEAPLRSSPRKTGRPVGDATGEPVVTQGMERTEQLIGDRLSGQARTTPGAIGESAEQGRLDQRASPVRDPLEEPRRLQATQQKTPVKPSSTKRAQEERKRKRDLENETLESSPSKRGHTSPHQNSRSRNPIPVIIPPSPPRAIASKVSSAAHVAGAKHSDTSTTTVPETPAPASLEPTDPTDPARELLLELPFFPADTASEESQDDEDVAEEDSSMDEDEDDDQTLSNEAWIDSRVRSGKAKDDRHALKALLCTSMDLKLADLVLEHQNSGKGIPENVPGVWTAEDDKCLEASDTRKIQRVLEKHGARNFEERWKFLSLTSGKFPEPSA